MTFEIGKAYPDAIGRMWYVACKATVEGKTILSVVQRRIGVPMKYGIGVVEDNSHATVLHTEGFTTIYDDIEELDETKENEEDDTTDELKPCPFCGGNVFMGQFGLNFRPMFHVHCSECGADGGYRPSYETALEHWNKRMNV